MKNAKYASCFLNQKNIMFIGVMRCMRERLFSFFFFFGKQLIENKFYFYKSFLLTKNSFSLINFFFYVTIHWKMWKIIFIESFPAKQTNHYDLFVLAIIFFIENESFSKRYFLKIILFFYIW